MPPLHVRGKNRQMEMEIKREHQRIGKKKLPKTWKRRGGKTCDALIVQMIAREVDEGLRDSGVLMRFNLAVGPKKRGRTRALGRQTGGPKREGQLRGTRERKRNCRGQCSDETGGAGRESGNY